MIPNKRSHKKYSFYEFRGLTENIKTNYTLKMSYFNTFTLWCMKNYCDSSSDEKNLSKVNFK